MKLPRKLAGNTIVIGPLLLIFIFAFIVRVLFLSEIPNGFHRDEVISGYVGRYILENGVDIYGNSWPLFFVDKYGDYPPSLPMYLSGLGTYFFGMTVFATRVPVALVGSVFIFPMYLLAITIFRKREIGILAAIGAAIVPWHIVLSRATAEGIVALTVASIGLWLLLVSLREGKKLYFLAGTALLLLTYLLYPSFRLLVPLILLPVPLFFNRTKLPVLYSIGALLLACVLTGFIASTDWGRGRYEQTSIFGPHRHPPLQEKIDHFIKDEGPDNVLQARIFHNKPLMYAREVLANYATYTSPSYLFLSGGYPYRYHIPDQGLLYMIFAVFLAAALYALYGAREKQFILYVWYLLLIAPLPAALTFDDAPNVHRSIFMVIPVLLLAAFGAYALSTFTKKKKIRIMLAVTMAGFLLLEVTYFFHQYVTHTIRYENRARASGNVRTMQAVVQRAGEYDRVLMPVHDAFPIYYLYFSANYDPSIAGKFGTFLRFDEVGNVRFVDSECPELPQEADRRVLIVESSECKLRPDLQLVTEIRRSDTSPLYRLVEHK